MKNKTLKDRAVVLGILLVVSLCVGIGYSTAYFRVNMTYDENKPEENKVVMSNAEVSFDGGDTVSLEHALPGDSVSKTFTITNNGSSTQLIGIDFSSITNTFVNNDIVYSLYEVVDDKDTLLVSQTVLPSTKSNTTSILDCTSIEKNTTKTYKLVLLFRETNTDQSVNMNKEVSATISLSAIDGTKCPTGAEKTAKLLSTLSDTVVDETDDKNIRYIGENPNNYIWFNCYDYSDTSTCERWRIIGVMNNVSTAENGTQSLIKIIRADEITDTSGNPSIYWDYTTTGEYYNLWDNTELKDYDSKTRTEGGATLRRVLNDAYYGTEIVTTGGSGTYKYSKDSSNTTLPRGITTQTLDKIEKVNWNVTPANYSATASTYYTTTGIVWSGYIGLMDPADYGFATSGGDTGRGTCLGYNLYNWSSYSDCYSNSWIRYYDPTDSEPKGSISSDQWTIRPYSGYSYGALYVYNNGLVYYDSVDYRYTVRPALYLSSNVSIIADEDSDGSYKQPYILS